MICGFNGCQLILSPPLKFVHNLTTAYGHEYIGNCIRTARRAKKINQKEFAKRLDKSVRTIQKYEAGEIDLNISTVKAIANELDMFQILEFLL